MSISRTLPKCKQKKWENRAGKALGEIEKPRMPIFMRVTTHAGNRNRTAA